MKKEFVKADIETLELKCTLQGWNSSGCMYLCSSKNKPFCAKIVNPTSHDHCSKPDGELCPGNTDNPSGL